MSDLKKIGRTTRELFNKPFYILEVKLTIMDENLVFIGSARDELERINDSIFEEEIGLDEKLEKIARQINPMSSTMLIDGAPFIPGSTLKGMIRFRVEHSFKPDKNGRIYSCFIKQDNPGQVNDVRNFLNKFGYFPDIVKPRPEENVSSNSFCKVCNLFGNTNLASRVIFSDAVAIEFILDEIQIKVRNGIDNKRVIAPQSVFTFTINVNNAEKEDLALLYLGMNLHEDGMLLLGLNKFSTQKDEKGQVIHFGKIKLEITKIKEFSFSFKGFSEKERSTIEEIGEFNKKIIRRIENFGDELRNFHEAST